MEVLVNGDLKAEPAETFYVNLVNPVNASIATGGGQGIGTILDDDSRGASYYVNDASVHGDVFTTAPGDNGNDGKTPATPVASLPGLLSLYTFHPGDTIYVDTGAYTLTRDLVFGPQFSGVRIIGPGARQVAPTLTGDEVLADQPVAFWRLGDAGSTTAADSSGHGHDGVYVGGVSPDPDGPSNDGASRFDGMGGNVEVTNPPSLGSGGFTFEAWVDFQGAPTQVNIDLLSVGNYALTYGSGQIGIQGGTQFISATLASGVWTHVVATVDDTAETLYFDGVPVASSPIASPPLVLDGQPLRIGYHDANPGTFTWMGGIDEVALYDKVLTPDRVLAHFARAGFVGAVLDRGNSAPGSYAVELAGATDVTLSNLSFTGGAAGIYAGGSAGSTGLQLGRVDVYGNRVGIALKASNDGATIVGSFVHGATESSGIAVDANDATIVGNAIYSNYFKGIETHGAHVSIVGNDIHDNGVYGIDAEEALHGLIRDNDVYRDGRLPGTGAIGIFADVVGVAASGADRLVIEGNRVHDHPDDGIVTFSGVYRGSPDNEVLISRNDVHDNGGRGIAFAGGTNTDVRENIVSRNGSGIVAQDEEFRSSTDAIVEANRVFGNVRVGITADLGNRVVGNWVYSNGVGIQGNAEVTRFGVGEAFEGSVENNLIYANSDAGIAILGADGAQVVSNTVYQTSGDAIRVGAFVAAPPISSRAVQVRNNILWTAAGYDINVSNDSQKGFQSNYNLLYTTGSGKVGFWQADYAKLRDWSFEVGLDTKSIAGDPLFLAPAGPDGILGVDPATGRDDGLDDNFHLRAGSPAIAAGDPTSDASAQPAPSGGRINLGAYGNTPEATTAGPAGVLVAQTGGSTSITVGGDADSYSISLTSPPSADVTISLASDRSLTLSTGSLTFTPANWSTAQVVSVKQLVHPAEVGDYVATITHVARSTDPNYNGLTVPSVAVQVANGSTASNGAAAATLSFGAMTFTYDGTAHAAVVATSPAGLSGVTVTYSQGGVPVAAPTHPGSYAVTASLSNPSYRAAAISGTLTIAKARPLVSWATPSAIAAGTALGPAQLDATASVPGVFVYSPTAGTALGVGMHQALSVTFVPSDSTDYDSVTIGTSIDVLSPASAPVIEFASASIHAEASDGTIAIILTRSGLLAAAATVTLSSPGGPGVPAFRRDVSFGPNETTTSATIALGDDGGTGNRTDAVPLTLSVSQAGVALGAIAQAILSVHHDATGGRPGGGTTGAPVTVTSVRLAKVKVPAGPGKKSRSAKTQSVIQVQFSGPINGAGNLAAYQVLSGKVARVHKKPVTTFARPVPLASARFDAATETVSLALPGKGTKPIPLRLSITAGLLTSPDGRALDGNRDGVPGGNFVATLNGSSVTIARYLHATRGAGQSQRNAVIRPVVR